MPIYEYYCPKCDLKFEVLKGVEERESSPCPSCSQEAKRLFSTFSFYFFNPLTVDGEGFTSKVVSNEQYKEMNRQIRER